MVLIISLPRGMFLGFYVLGGWSYFVYLSLDLPILYSVV